MDAPLLPTSSLQDQLLAVTRLEWQPTESEDPKESIDLGNSGVVRTFGPVKSTGTIGTVGNTTNSTFDGETESSTKPDSLQFP